MECIHAGRIASRLEPARRPQLKMVGERGGEGRGLGVEKAILGSRSGMGLGCRSRGKWALWRRYTISGQHLSGVAVEGAWQEPQFPQFPQFPPACQRQAQQRLQWLENGWQPTPHGSLGMAVLHQMFGTAAALDTALNRHHSGAKQGCALLKHTHASRKTAIPPMRPQSASPEPTCLPLNPTRWARRSPCHGVMQNPATSGSASRVQAVSVSTEYLLSMQ